MEFRKDLMKKKIFVKREFKAPVKDVWQFWTKSELLDQWWAPKPWKAVTKKMDFREGGSWLYIMQGPEGEQHFARADYEKIVPFKSFAGLDSFCDENGNIVKDPPSMHWSCRFSEAGENTIVDVEITFEKESDLEKIIEMGFREGFTAALGNLDEILEHTSIKK